MKIYPATLRGQTILLIAISLFLFYVFSLILYVFFSVATATLEREGQITDRIGTIITLIDHAKLTDRSYLAGELSGSRFQATVDRQPLVTGLNNSGAVVSNLIFNNLKPISHLVSADYLSDSILEGGSAFAPEREVVSQYIHDLLRIHETLLVSVKLADGNWLNFRILGSAWDHIFSFAAVPSMTLVMFGTILLTSWAVTRPLKSISRLARASEELATDVPRAQPIAEDGPKEIREAAQTFNKMQLQIQRLLEARNEMLGAVSHDFRTPITRLRIRVEELTDETQRHKAIRDLDEMEAMIKITLAYAKDEATEVHESIDVKGILCELVAEFDDSVVEISSNYDLNTRIFGQAVGLRRVFSNILENALFYGYKFHVELRSENHEVIVEVDDDGPGIESQYRDRVFVPFYRMESSRSRETGGTGLGLSIAQNIVHANGGTIELLDSPLGGLRVRIAFPEEASEISLDRI